MTRFLSEAPGEPPRRLPRARPRIGLWAATLVALVAVGGIVAATLAITESVAVGDGLRSESAVGYVVDVASQAAETPEPYGPDESQAGVPLPAAGRNAAHLPSATTPSVPITSARFEDVETTAGPAPVELRIPAIRVDAPVVPVGYQGEEMEVPSTAADVGWFRYGPAPGQSGSSVLAAHVAWRGEAGIFFDLSDLPSGSVIEVRFDDGSTRRFAAVASTSYDKRSLPVAEIFRRDGPPVLTLITCGGAFNPSLGSYQDNVVVHAVEISGSRLR